MKKEIKKSINVKNAYAFNEQKNKSCMWMGKRLIVCLKIMGKLITEIKEVRCYSSKKVNFNNKSNKQGLRFLQNIFFPTIETNSKTTKVFTFQA